MRMKVKLAASIVVRFSACRQRRELPANAVIASALVVPAVYSITRPDPEAKAKADGLQTLVSEAYRLDKIYHSMEGPWSIQSGIHLAAGAKSGVQWVTGLETEVVDAAVQKPI